MLNVPYISIVNLLADRMLFPEYLTSKDESEAIAGQVLNWLEKPLTAAAVRHELSTLQARVGQPGACAKAAEVILTMAGRREVQPSRQSA